jgi:hypothetical protein
VGALESETGVAELRDIPRAPSTFSDVQRLDSALCGRRGHLRDRIPLHDVGHTYRCLLDDLNQMLFKVCVL